MRDATQIALEPGSALEYVTRVVSVVSPECQE